MPIQTIEEAVNAYSEPLSFDEIAEMPFTAVRNAFKAGASWQRERDKDMAEALKTLTEYFEWLTGDLNFPAYINAKSALSKALD